MVMGEGEVTPGSLYRWNRVGVAAEVAPWLVEKVAVEDVDQSFLVVSVAGCCHYQGPTQGLGSGACCGAWVAGR